MSQITTTEGYRTGGVSAAARRRAQGQAGQSLTVAIIVLFLLLFLAGIFIAIVAGNLKNTRTAVNVSAAGRYAEAGVKYLDEQLTKSPEGADWRPVPDCTFGADCSSVISQNDPDYFWLKPYDANSDEGGFTRVNIGSDIPGDQNRGGAIGGRALVRITYLPGQTDLNTGQPNPLSRYIRLESVGRAGQVDPKDPTTYRNSEALSQRVELVAYKAINLNEYVLQVTNKDNKPITAALGAQPPVRDRNAQGALVLRSIDNIIQGPVRVNGALTFFGVNRLTLDPTRGEFLEVAGPISLNNVLDTTLATKTTDSTRVYISTTGLGANDIKPGPTDLPNLLPSFSPNFTTLGPEVAQRTNSAGFALVRDNPRGNEVQGLPADIDPATKNAFQNLRSVGRITPPVIDAPTGPDGLTRYRALTRDSAPLASQYTQANPLSGNALNNAGFFGWGEGLYLNNAADAQPEGTMNGGFSLRTNWLNPGTKDWQSDYKYTPPAVTITLTPRYLKIAKSAQSGNSFSFRHPNGGGRLTTSTVIRYTGVQNQGAPAIDQGPNTVAFEGYPAAPATDPVNGANFYEGDFVVYAEGNVRIRGVAGGYDPETKTYFKRHLTIVSNGNIYVDGNLLRDNVTADNTDAAAKAVRGQSTIALLAKNNIAVNTTQFLSPSEVRFQGQSTPQDPSEPTALHITASAVTGGSGGVPFFSISAAFGPVVTDPTKGFETPSYLATGAANSPSLFLRHTADSTQGYTAVNLLVNSPYPLPTGQAGNQFDFGGGNKTFTLGDGDSIVGNTYAYDRIGLYSGANSSFLFPNPVYPYSPANAPLPTIGLGNVLTLVRDPSYTSPTGSANGNVADYDLTRFGVVPLDVRIEALMYAQEGSFFIIPGPWFNPNPNDTIENFLLKGFRADEARSTDLSGSGRAYRVDPMYPFYQQPMDIRITFCGSISENLTAEVADQGAWMQKWGWIPTIYGSTGLRAKADPAYPDQQAAPVFTVHGVSGTYPGGDTANNGKGNGIVYEFDQREVMPYAPEYSSDPGKPLRPNPYNPTQPLPFAPRLPVAPGLLYYGQNTQTR